MKTPKEEILTPKQQILQEILRLEGLQPRAVRECLLTQDCERLEDIEKNINDLRDLLSQFEV